MQAWTGHAILRLPIGAVIRTPYKLYGQFEFIRDASLYGGFSGSWLTQAGSFKHDADVRSS